MLAFTCDLLTKVVVRALLHFTAEMGTKPVPLTVSVNPALPGAWASGTRGWLISGMGLCAPQNPVKVRTAAIAVAIARQSSSTVNQRCEFFGIPLDSQPLGNNGPLAIF